MAKPAAVNHDREAASLEDGVISAPILDLVHLSRQTMGDQALETELLSLFDRQAGQFAARLAESCRASDFSARASLAHTLKGSSQAIGAFRLAEAAAAYEDALRAEGEDDGLREALIGAIDAARAAIGALSEKAA